MIVIFDYGAGNLRSVENTLGELGATYEIVRNAEGLDGRTRSSCRAWAISAR